MDGVLIDSSIAVEKTYADWARENGFDVQAVLGVVHGRRTVEVVKEFGFGDDPETEADRLELLIAEKATIAHAIEPGCNLYRRLDPGRVAVATSARRATALSNLRVLELDEPAVLVTGQDVEHGKPAPDPYLLAAERLEVRADECVVIEDAPAGVEAGRSAGAWVVGLTTTHAPDELAAADLVIPPDQLAEVFTRLLT